MENQSVDSDKSLFSEQEIIYKEYHYVKNGKDIIIKRKWTKTNKQQEFKEYFDKNKDIIKNMKMKDILTDYNKTHTKVSQGTFSKYFAIYKATNEILKK